MTADEMLKRPVIVGIGEILWDIFPDGPQFGGAPANFCCSAAELARKNADIFMVSGVGCDDLGNLAMEQLQSHEVSTHYVQRMTRPTGKVLVDLDSQGVASYRFEHDTAWDNLVWSDQLQQLAEQSNVVCFGTLGQRCPSSRRVIQRFVKASRPQALRILDINIREPHCTDEVILESLALANVLKLNDAELPYLAGLCKIPGSDIEQLQEISARFSLRCVALTRGVAGAVIVAGSAISDLPGARLEVVDTVGAGDAFTAAMSLGMLLGLTEPEINRLAISAAAHVCTQAGGTPKFPESLQCQFQ